MKNLGIINGPNLNTLGARTPELYGTTTLRDLINALQETAEKYTASILHFQSNHEGEIIDTIQEWSTMGLEGIIINPAAFSHYSIAIRDAIEASPATFIEVHITNIKDREPFRHHSITGEVCHSTILGRGIQGYHDALNTLLHL